MRNCIGTKVNAQTTALSSPPIIPARTGVDNAAQTSPDYHITTGNDLSARIDVADYNHVPRMA
jgi:hypothetical protein